MDQLTKKTKAELLKMAETAKLKVDPSMKKDILSAKILLSTITDRASYKFSDLKKADLELLCKAEGANVRGKNKQDLVDRLCRGASPEPLPDLPKDVIGTIIEKIDDPNEARRIAKILKDAYSIRRIEEADKTIEKLEIRVLKGFLEVQRKDYPSKESFEYNIAALLQLILYGSRRENIRPVKIRLTDKHGQYLEIEPSSFEYMNVFANGTLIARLIFTSQGDYWGSKKIEVLKHDANRLWLLRWLKLMNFKENKAFVELTEHYNDREVERVMKQVRREIKKDIVVIQTEVDKLFKNGILLPKSVEKKLVKKGSDFKLFDLHDVTPLYDVTPLLFMLNKQNDVYIPKSYPYWESKQSSAIHYYTL